MYRHLGKQARRLNVSCYRVYDHDLPEFPFCIELYEDKLSVAEYKRHHRYSEQEHDDWIRGSMAVIGEVFEMPSENIFLKLRQVKAGRTGQYKAAPKLHEEGASSAGLLRENEFVVRENGLRFIVNLNDYIDTGLFLDHRNTRAMVQKEAKNKKILNLFCYTGSFSVYAGAGGADKVVSVDLSKTYLDWAERNMQLNGLMNSTAAKNDKYDYVQADVMEYVKKLERNHFDIVILDPPTFSNSQRMKSFFDIQRNHAALINDCLRTLGKHGVLFFSTNFSKFVMEKEKIKAGSIKDITKATTPFDFRGKLSRYCFRIEAEH